MFHFLHAADVHLDSPLRGLERYENAPVEQIRQASRRALDNLVQLAIDEKVAFVLLAGDLYDGDWKDYNTGLFLASRMSQLREAGIPVFAIAGNHDAANRMTRVLRMPDNVHLLSADEPETHVIDKIGVAIHGQSFATQAVHDDLSQRYPVMKRGYFNIGLLHTCASCPSEHERYAPCTIDGLRSRHYSYWALGHVHQRQVLHSDPPIVFPGNLQGRHIRETGAKGCLLVTVADGSQTRMDFRCLDVLRWEHCRVDVTGVEAAADVIDSVADQVVALRQRSDGRPLAVRVEVLGACPAHEALLGNVPRWTAEVRAAAATHGGDQVWIEKVKLSTRSQRGPSPALDGPIEELLGVLDQLRTDDASLGEVAGLFADLRRKLPAEFLAGPDACDPADPGWLRGLLDQVQPLLLQRLQAGEAAG